MIVYSVTINLQPDIEADWVQWMRQTHIPDVLNTGCFSEASLHKLLIPETEDDSVSYNVQYLLVDMQQLQRYQNEFATALQAEHTARYEGKFIAFRTILERTATFSAA